MSVVLLAPSVLCGVVVPMLVVCALAGLAVVALRGRGWWRLTAIVAMPALVLALATFPIPYPDCEQCWESFGYWTCCILALCCWSD